MQSSWRRQYRPPDLQARQSVTLSAVGGPFWSDKPVAIVAGGPSLTHFDFDQLRGHCHVLAVSASMFDIPFAAAGFCLDHIGVRNWWERFKALPFEVWIGADGPFISGPNSKPSANMRFIQRTKLPHISESSRVINGGGTSGFGAINLAVLKGARRIFLFGYDYGTTTGIWHHNQANYQFAPAQQEKSKWLTWADNFDLLKAPLRSRQVSIINCSPASAITAFPRTTVEEGTWLLRTSSEFS